MVIRHRPTTEEDHELKTRLFAAAAIIATTGLSLTGYSAANAAPVHYSAASAVLNARLDTKPAVSPVDSDALAQAHSYSSLLHLSKAALYDQLHSKYGGQFSKAASKYAVDHVHADWNHNALLQARSYEKLLHLSPAGIYDQLVSQYGGQFTSAQAHSAVKHL